MTDTEVCPNCPTDIPKGTGVCGECELEEELQVVCDQLDDLKRDVRELLEALPQRAWTERVTGALQRLKARVS